MRPSPRAPYAQNQEAVTKNFSLIALFLLSLVGPVAEGLCTGRIDPAPFATWGLGETLLGVLPLYAWYYADKYERRFRAGALQNVGVAVFALIGLPVYFIRSRGCKRGALASLISLGVLIALTLLGEAGEWIGAWAGVALRA
jgi:hypothetical protein